MILDTSFLIDLLRGSDNKAKEKAEKLDHEFRVKGTTTITVMELWRGAMKSLHTEEEKKKVNELLKALLIYPLREKDAKKAGEIEAKLIKNGEMVDLEDIMISGICLARNETILTKNTKHFNRIEGLNVESY